MGARRCKSGQQRTRSCVSIASSAATTAALGDLAAASAVAAAAAVAVDAAAAAAAESIGAPPRAKCCSRPPTSMPIRAMRARPAFPGPAASRIRGCNTLCSASYSARAAAAVALRAALNAALASFFRCVLDMGAADGSVAATAGGAAGARGASFSFMSVQFLSVFQGGGVDASISIWHIWSRTPCSWSPFAMCTRIE